MQSLEGIRILDLSRLLPGPYATQLLANLGAEVIKVERPPEGDYARMMPPYITLDAERAEGAVFWRNNRGKKSIALDFYNPQGREILLRLCQQADALIESFRPGVMAQRGLDYPSVRARSPRLIYCSLSGYGQDGPYRDRAGHDLNYLALAGILKMNGATGAAPVLPAVQIADLAGGMSAALQIAAALVEREHTGAGKFLDIALFDAAADWMQTILGACYRAENENPRRGATPLTGAYPCYNIYETSDGEYMSLGALEPKFWRSFCAAVERVDLIDREFDTESIAGVGEIFKQRTRAEWTRFSEQTDCCLEPLLEVNEALAHPQFTARDLARRDGEVPRLGQHTREILRDAGYSASELEEFFASGIAGADG